MTIQTRHKAERDGMRELASLLARAYLRLTEISCRGAVSRAENLDKGLDEGAEESHSHGRERTPGRRACRPA